MLFLSSSSSTSSSATSMVKRCYQRVSIPLSKRCINTTNSNNNGRISTVTSYSSSFSTTTTNTSNTNWRRTTVLLAATAAFSSSSSSSFVSACPYSLTGSTCTNNGNNNSIYQCKNKKILPTTAFVTIMNNKIKKNNIIDYYEARRIMNNYNYRQQQVSSILQLQPKIPFGGQIIENQRRFSSSSKKKTKRKLKNRRKSMKNNEDNIDTSLDGGDNNNNSSDMESLNPREQILMKSPKEDKEIVKETLDWLTNVVIGLNLCPFADKPYKNGNLSIEVNMSTNQVDILSHILMECQVRQNRKGTSLIICPNLFPSNFYSFLEVYNMVQDGLLVDNDLTDDIQIAPFHPLFEFESKDEDNNDENDDDYDDHDDNNLDNNDTNNDSIDNWTNRSPYPIFHILREEEVDIAVDALQGDSSKVWKRNIQLLEQLEDTLESREETERLLSGKEIHPTQLEKVKDIIRRLKG